MWPQDAKYSAAGRNLDNHMKSKALGHRAITFRGCCGSVPPHRSADTTGGTIKNVIFSVLLRSNYQFNGGRKIWEEARKCIACLNWILWGKHKRKERKFNIFNALINL